MTHKGLNSDDFLRLSEQVWPIQKNHLFMARKNGCPSVADLTHFGALVEREVLRRASESQAPAVAHESLPQGWKFNHTQQAKDSDGELIEGVWEIGWLDEDDHFSELLTLDTDDYFQPEVAEPLARAILARLMA